LSSSCAPNRTELEPVNYRANRVEQASNRIKRFEFMLINSVNMQEAKAMVARSRTHALGAQENVQGVIKTDASIDLFNTFKFGNARDDHSAQFTLPIQRVWGYYDEVLTSYNLQHIAR